jgi:hypothetical protein
MIMTMREKTKVKRLASCALCLLTLVACKKTEISKPLEISSSRVESAHVPVDAQAENARGMKRYRAKDWAGAAQAFRGALEVNPKYVVAHYNLACVAALLGDKAAAVTQLVWLAGSDDPNARLKLIKAATDRDLATISSDPTVKKMIAEAKAADLWRSLFSHYRPLAEARPANTREAELIGEALGDCDEECKREPRALEAELDAQRPGPETLVAQEDRGVALFDHEGRLLASWDEDWGDPRQDSVVSIGQVIPDAEPEIVILETTGRPSSYTQQVMVLKRRGEKLAEVLSETVYGYDARTLDDGEEIESEDVTRLTLERSGLLRRHDGSALRFDASAFKFVPAL